MKARYIALFWFLVVCFCGGVWFFAIKGVAHTCPLLSPTELQERLGVKADGIIGDETMTAWNEAYIEQSAGKYMAPFVGEDDKLHFYDER